MKSIIIDDEPDAVEALHLTLMEVCPEVAVSGKYTDPEKGLAAIRTQKPDLLFLDMEMPMVKGVNFMESSSIYTELMAFCNFKLCCAFFNGNY